MTFARIAKALIALSCTFVSGATGLQPALAQTATPQIEWHVKNPFRFFLPQADGEASVFFKMHQDTLKKVQEESGRDIMQPISKIEAKLNNADNLNYESNWLRGFYLSQRTGPLAKAADPVRGWAKYAVTESQTCWARQDQRHTNCKNYVMPKVHAISLSLKGTKIGEGVNCIWSSKVKVFGKTGNQKSETKACNEAVTANIPFKPDPATGKPDGTLVYVQVTGQAAKISTLVSVRDYLIVGMGDSFASGEGNPDSPAQMAENPDKTAFDDLFYSNAISDNGLDLLDTRSDLRFRAKKGQAVVVIAHRKREVGAQAYWLDRSCHRSLYSYQFRVALQKALEAGPDEAVTYLGYGCSGAKITEGLLEPYSGVETIVTRQQKGADGKLTGGLTEEGKDRRDMPQVARLIEELCQKKITNKPNQSLPACGKGKPADFLRPVDLLLLSIGVNDVHFSAIVADAAMNPDREKRRAISGLAKRVIAELPQQNLIDALEGNYSSFFAKLTATEIAIRKTGNKSNIVVPAYPLGVANNKNGVTCGVSEPEQFSGLTASPGLLKLDSAKLAKVSEFSEKLNAKMKQSLRERATFLNDGPYQDSFKKHGICATTQSGAVTSNTDNSREWMQIPLRSHSNDGLNGWFKGMNGSKWPCYASRQRWVRSFDDAYLCSNTWAEDDYPLKRKLTAEHIAALSMGGPVHPTAQGHAHVADAVWKKIKELKLLEN